MIAMITTAPQGDREFFTELFEDYERLMFSIAGKYTDSGFDREDIVQESLVRLMNNADTVKGLHPKALASYIAVTVKHTAINHLRKSGHTVTPLTDTMADELPDGGDDMDTRIIRRDDLGKLSAVWPRLNESERYVLEGKYLCGYTDAELAAELGCREASIRMKLTRARRHALKLLTEEGVSNE